MYAHLSRNWIANSMEELDGGKRSSGQTARFWDCSATEGWLPVVEDPPPSPLFHFRFNVKNAVTNCPAKTGPRSLRMISLRIVSQPPPPLRRPRRATLLAKNPSPRNRASTARSPCALPMPGHWCNGLFSNLGGRALGYGMPAAGTP